MIELVNDYRYDTLCPIITAIAPLLPPLYWNLHEIPQVYTIFTCYCTYYTPSALKSWFHVTALAEPW